MGKFKPLEESIAIVKKMLDQETRRLSLEMNGYTTDPNPERVAEIESAIDYWTRRLHGYQKLLSLRTNQASPVYQPRSSSK